MQICQYYRVEARHLIDLVSVQPEHLHYLHKLVTKILDLQELVHPKPSGRANSIYSLRVLNQRPGGGRYNSIFYLDNSSS